METTARGQSRIFTIPNLLSLLRILMIPLLVWLYCGKEDPFLTTLVLLLSGMTDIVDAFIARRFQMTSDLGKVLDPVADKLTQGVMLICLVTRFPHMLIPLCLLILKELFAAVSGAMVIRRTGVVMGAQWHGKAATVSLYGMMLIHLLWDSIPVAVSWLLVGLCAAVMLYSAIRYGVRNLRAIREKEQRERRDR